MFSNTISFAPILVIVRPAASSLPKRNKRPPTVLIVVSWFSVVVPLTPRTTAPPTVNCGVFTVSVLIAALLVVALIELVRFTPLAAPLITDVLSMTTL